MLDVDDYFIWVRVVDVTQAAEPAPVHLLDEIVGAGPFQPLTRLDMLNGSRPPNNVVAERPSDPAKSPRLGVWSATEEFFGREGADTAFEYGPAFVDHESARCWITSGPGRTWDAAARNRFLLTFTHAAPKPATTANAPAAEGANP